MDIIHNEETTCENLKKILEKNFGNEFIFHSEFYNEFTDLVSKSGEEKKVIDKFLSKLNAILMLNNIDYGPKWLEHLTEYGNMYSLHIDTNNSNYRLLFSKSRHGKYFLRMFFEKEGKKVTSYSSHVPIAIQRRDSE